MSLQDKETIRKNVLRIRSKISGEYRNEAERKIVEKLLSLEFFKRAASVMCYIDIRGEVGTESIIKHCIDSGKRISVPRVICKGGMDARRITCTDSQLEKCAYGIMEPVCSLTAESNPEEFDVIIVPGVAFGKDMHRIGYGEGYYDSYLKKTSKSSIKVGLAFDIQIIDSVPSNEMDEPVDLIITESQIIGRVPEQEANTVNGGIT